MSISTFFVKKLLPTSSWNLMWVGRHGLFIACYVTRSSLNVRMASLYIRRVRMPGCSISVLRLDRVGYSFEELLRSRTNFVSFFCLIVFYCNVMDVLRDIRCRFLMYMNDLFANDFLYFRRNPIFSRNRGELGGNSHRWMVEQFR